MTGEAVGAEDTRHSTGPRATGGMRWQRRKATTRMRIEQAALRLFEERGFDACTVDELAAAAGVGRRTFFRYFPTKSDVVSAGATEQLGVLLETLHATAHPHDPVELLRTAFHRANDFPPEEYAVLASRIRLAQTVPALQAHTAARYGDWEDALTSAVAEYFPTMAGLPAEALAKATLAVMWAAYGSWLEAGAGPDLHRRIDTVFDLLRSGFTHPATSPTPDRTATPPNRLPRARRTEPDTGSGHPAPAEGTRASAAS